MKNIIVIVLIVIACLTVAFNRDKIKNRIWKKKWEEQDNQSDYNLGLRAFNKGDYETALFFFSEICKKEDGKKFKDSYEMRKKSEQALKARYEEKRRKNRADIDELYSNGQYEKALYRLEHESFLVNPLPDTSALYENCRSNLYDIGVHALQRGDYETARSIFLKIRNYRDCSSKIELCSELIHRNKKA